MIFILRNLILDSWFLNLQMVEIIYLGKNFFVYLSYLHRGKICFLSSWNWILFYVKQNLKTSDSYLKDTNCLNLQQNSHPIQRILMILYYSMHLYFVYHFTRKILWKRTFDLWLCRKGVYFLFFFVLSTLFFISFFQGLMVIFIAVSFILSLTGKFWSVFYFCKIIFRMIKVIFLFLLVWVIFSFIYLPVLYISFIISLTILINQNIYCCFYPVELKNIQAFKLFSFGILPNSLNFPFFKNKNDKF